MANDIKKLSANLDGLSAKVTKLKEKMKGLKEGTDQHLQATKKLNAALKKQAAAQDKLEKSGRTLTKNNKNHTQAIKSKTAALKRAEAATRSNSKADTKSAGLFGRMTGALGARISTLGKYLIATKLIQLGVQALSALFVGTTKASLAFANAMGNLAAVTEASQEQMGRLREVALETAGVTKLTAVEVVNLQRELAKLGTSADDIERLTKPIAQLSQALGETGAEVALVFKNILNQFDLTTLASVDVANSIQKTIANSALTLQGLGVGFGYVGTQAAISGLSVQETAANLAILADNGLKASKAGTGFRNVLVAATKAGKTYNDFLDELAEKGLSSSEALELFGKRAATAGLLLVRNREEVLALSETLNDNKAVLEAQIDQMGNAAGTVEQLKSAYNALQISIGDNITNSNFFIGVLKLINAEAGRTAQLFKALASGSQDTRDSFNDLVDAFARLDSEGEVDVFATPVDEINDTLAKVLPAGQLLDKATKAYREEIANGQRDANDSLFDYLQDHNIRYKGLLKQATTVTNEAISEGRLRLQGQFDDIAKTEPFIDSVIKKTQEFESQALGGTYDEGEGRAFEERINSEIDKREKSVEILAGMVQEEIDLWNADTANDGIERQISNTELALGQEQAGLDILKNRQKAILVLQNSEQAADGNRRAAISKEAETIRERIRVRKEALKDELQQNKDILEAELLRTETIEDLSEREAAVAAARVGYAESVSAANNNAASDINGFIPVYEENLKIVTKAVDELQRKGQLTQESGLGIFKKVISDFGKSQKELDDLVNKSFEDGGISQGQYESRTEALRGAFETQINALIETFGIEGDAADAVRAKVAEFMNTPYELKGSTEGTQNPLEKALGVDPNSIDFQIEKLKELVGNTLEVYRDFGKEKLDNLKNEADAELDVIKERYSIEQDILKSNLDNQLITEGQFRVKSAELKKAQLAEENSINKKLFEEQKKQDRANAVAAGLESIAQATILAYTTKDPFISAPIQAALSSGVIAATTAAKIGAIGTRKFFPKKFEDGGVVSGPSHAEGGVPFTVQGRGGYEMEGGEYIINKRSASMHKELLDRINSSGRTSAVVGTQKFAQGGEVVGLQAQGNTEEYLRVIAQSNADIAAESKKPTRAFVSSTDLRTDSRERSIRNNNDRV